jgi:hypothetical protein
MSIVARNRRDLRLESHHVYPDGTAELAYRPGF